MSAPGWHRDPSGAPRLRYWDGRRWTEEYAPLPRSRGISLVLVVMALVVVLVLVAFGVALR